MGSFSRNSKTANMKVFVALSCLLALSYGSSLNQFAEFKQKYNKNYASLDEELSRYKVFKANLEAIEKHNRLSSSYKKGVNFFTDLTEEEFKATHLGLKTFPSSSDKASIKRSQSVKSIRDLPDSVNWVDAGATTSVKDQGQCGSCWAFSLTSQVESYYFIETNELLELSTQQVTSCTPNTLSCGGTGGCRGSVTQLGFNYLQLFGSIAEGDWPYVSGSTGDGGDCTYDLNSMNPVVSLAGYNSLPPNDEAAVMQHLAEVGPLAIAVDASKWGAYQGGVFDGCSFDENISINHGVQLVGYGTEYGPLGTFPYWLVRNSWGPNWGENGFIKMKRTAECGVNSTPMDGTACVGGPGNDEQTVCGMCGMLLDTTYPLGVQKWGN